MKKIRVYLQYPWKFPDSPYYKYLIKDPPKNVEFLNVTEQRGAMTNVKKFWLSNFLKRNIRKWLSKLNTSVLNAHYTKTSEQYDLIQCAHCLSKNDSPWIADFECGWQYFVGKETKRINEKAKKLILSSNCKKILAWTNKTRDEMVSYLPEIKNKIEVVYPAVPVQILKRRKHTGINLVFVARYFDQKGGYHALEVMKKLTKKYENVRGIIVSTVPEEVINANKENKKIIFYPLMPQKDVFEKVYSIADISIYPAYADSFGFGILEAMSFGIPIVSVDGYSRKEIITDGKTGFVVNYPPGVKDQYDFDWKSVDKLGEEVIENMVAKASKLIENSGELKRMSRNCLEEIKKGKFSIKRRNKILEKIYGEAKK
ncbi:D-inositol-3-phosphate glycosyltransferase [uncultured archaeon]|nr:D-inositol-3-phosphate glycosyltransferase [uncultured archaeon]